MSDPKSTYGEPVEEPTPEGDVVGRAEEGLAEAEAAGRDGSRRAGGGGTRARRRAGVRGPRSRARARRSPSASPSPSRLRRRARAQGSGRLCGRLRAGSDAETVVAAPVVTPSEPA